MFKVGVACFTTWAEVAHLHLQDLLQPLHDDQRGPLDCRVTVLRTVLHHLHQRLVGCRAEVALVTIGPADTTAAIRPLRALTSGYPPYRSVTRRVFWSPVCGLQKLVDNDLEGGRQTVGAGFIHVLGSVCGLVGCFSQRRERLKAQRPGGVDHMSSWRRELDRLRFHVQHLARMIYATMSNYGRSQPTLQQVASKLTGKANAASARRPSAN